MTGADQHHDLPFRPAPNVIGVQVKDPDQTKLQAEPKQLDKNPEQEVALEDHLAGHRVLPQGSVDAQITFESCELAHHLTMLLFYDLSSDSGIFSDTAMPGKTRQAVSRRCPRGLDEQTTNQAHAAGFAHVNTDGKIELIGKRREVKRLFDTVRQNIQGKQMTAGDVFEGKQNEDER